MDVLPIENGDSQSYVGLQEYNEMTTILNFLVSLISALTFDLNTICH